MAWAGGMAWAGSVDPAAAGVSSTTWVDDDWTATAQSVEPAQELSEASTLDITTTEVKTNNARVK
jgi:hypothetical protein